jgi:putative endonuclease
MNPSGKKQKQALGKLGEQLAATYLQKRGFKIIERNFHARYGEIDLIAQDKDTLVFVEVKTRSSDQFGSPEEAVTARKLRGIMQTAHVYAAMHHAESLPQRIDVVAIRIQQGGMPAICHFKHVP